MPVVSIDELKAQFDPGKKLSSEYFQNLVDTLADDRAALHVGPTGPVNPESTPIWFNDFDSNLSVYSGSSWILVFQGTNYSLPVEDGLPGQVLSTDGNGNVAWVSI
jgi:hypothetical protein